MRVLLIEDNPIDAQVLRDRLTESGETDIVLEHVESFDSLIGPWTGDLLLLDLSLPGSEGVESMRRARALVGGVPIVILTGDDDAERALVMLREGAQDYLVKGRYSADSLLRAMRYAIERHDLLQRLTRADRLAAVGRMAAGVAHEVSNPATLVLGHAERVPYLLDRLEAMVARNDQLAIRQSLEHLRRIAHESRSGLARIQLVVRELQGYSRVEGHQTERFQLNDVVLKGCRLAGAVLGRHAKLQRSLGAVSFVQGHPAKLEQVLTNLLMNAVHAFEGVERRDPRIDVATWEERDQVHLSVEDNGCGIPEPIRARVFEPFFTTKARERGTGLGLAVAFDIVQQHGGTIRCESREGQGTRFEIRLPRAVVQTPLAVSTESIAPPSGVRQRVLLVDDEADILGVYAELLGEHHDVTIAHGGTEAIGKLDTAESFDIVVCDLMMPEVDGIAVFEQARKLRPELAERFVFYSGGVVTDRAQRFREEQNGEFLYKPVPFAELRAAIERAANR